MQIADNIVSIVEAAPPPIDMKLTFRERFTAKQLQEQMRRLRKSWQVSVPTQALMLQRDRLDARLEEDLTLERTLTLIEDYLNLIHQIQRDAAEADRQKLVDMRQTWESLLGREVKR